MEMLAANELSPKSEKLGSRGDSPKMERLVADEPSPKWERLGSRSNSQKMERLGSRGFFPNGRSWLQSSQVPRRRGLAVEDSFQMGEAGYGVAESRGGEACIIGPISGEEAVNVATEPLQRTFSVTLTRVIVLGDAPTWSKGRGKGKEKVVVSLASSGGSRRRVLAKNTL
ncbi:hypothetical protein Fot_19962 [Forsythia ovata]|uniref:Uncharacterized protein n=1 Tax=Forsythia ovata TaxID=205694 RepID=A0ABD1VMJ3_9LAMI